MKNILIAGCGGFIGTCLRYFFNNLFDRFASYPAFPYGTLFINVTGCLAIGLLAGLAESREVFTSELRIFIFIGILGGYTTFSTFGYETFTLLRDGQFLLASANVLLQVFLGLIALGLAYNFSRTL
jgi:CrcB protein